MACPLQQAHQHDGQFLDHLAEDAMSAVIEKLSEAKTEAISTNE
jgi:hypothetical protein